MTKVCNYKKCKHNGKPQPISNFHKAIANRDGLCHRCKDCVSDVRKGQFTQSQQWLKIIIG